MKTVALLFAALLCAGAASADQYVLFGPKPGSSSTCPWDCC